MKRHEICLIIRHYATFSVVIIVENGLLSIYLKNEFRRQEVYQIIVIF